MGSTHSIVVDKNFQSKKSFQDVEPKPSQILSVADPVVESYIKAQDACSFMNTLTKKGRAECYEARANVWISFKSMADKLEPGSTKSL